MRKAIVLIAMLCFAGIVSAQAPSTETPSTGAGFEAQATALHAQLLPFGAKRKELRPIGAALATELVSINADVAAYKKANDLALAQQTDLKARMEIEAAAVTEQAAALASHNGNECIYSASNPGACDAYTAEQSRLNERTAYLQAVERAQNKERLDLNATIEKNAEFRTNFETRNKEYTAKAKVYNDAYNANEAAIQKVVDQIKVLQGQYDKCSKPLLADNTDRSLHEACGMPFDIYGNINKPVVNEGTGSKLLGPKS